VEIRKDDLTGETIAAFLREHLQHMHEITPPESVHALDLEKLRSPEITFWAAWDGNDLLGCGALKELDISTGEIKSMRTAIEHRRKGVASKILHHIITVAQQRAYRYLFLETGAMAEFAPAQALYERYGFEYRGPFGDYIEDPNSVFMVKKL
jgi:putative acetyltransferase